MRHILAEDSVGLVAQIAASKVLLAFDFDGTLAPIVSDPDAAAMRPRTMKLLSAVCKQFPCAVISGRSRGDVSARLAGALVKYVVGNHGIDPGAEGLEGISGDMKAIRLQLETALGGCEGIDVENKRYSIAVHYRRSRRKRDALAAIRTAAAALRTPVRLVAGKLVVNVLPATAPHKGDALMALRAAEGADTALYVGDDVTDEDVFALDQPGRLLSVRVGRSASSSAAFFLGDQREMDLLLRMLTNLRKDPSEAMRLELTGDEPPDYPLGPALDFLAHIWALNHAIERVSTRTQRALRISAPQRLVLRCIGKFPGITAGHAARLLHVDPGTLSAALRRLEGQKLLERHKDPRDRRRILLGLTAKGRALDRPMPHTVEHAVERLLTLTDPADLEAAARTLTKLAALLLAELSESPTAGEPPPPARERPARLERTRRRGDDG